MPLVYLKLTKKQADSLGKGKGARITPSGVVDMASVYAVDMDAKDYKRYTKAVLNGKGCIVKGTVLDEASDDEVEGGKINWKKVGRRAKKLVNTVGVDAIEGAKKAIPEKVAKQAIEKGVTGAVLGATTFIGAPNPQLAAMAGQAAGNATGAAYDTDFRKKGALNQFSKNFVDETKDDLMKGAVSSFTGGALNMKKAKRAVKKVANKVAPILQEAKQYVPREALKEAVKKNARNIALKITDNEDIADRVGRYSDRVVDAGYDADLSDADAGKRIGRKLRDTKREIVRDSKQYATNQITQALTGGKLVKGSPEAKAYMASLRSKRKTATGNGMVQSRIANIESKMAAGKGMVPLGKGMVPL